MDRRSCFLLHADDDRAGHSSEAARGRRGKPLYSGDAAGPWSNPGRRSSWCGARMHAPFQTVDYAERYTREIPETVLVRIKSAGDIPMKNDPKAGAGVL